MIKAKINEAFCDDRLLIGLSIEANVVEFLTFTIVL
jgi:hypothetical protein